MWVDRRLEKKNTGRSACVVFDRFCIEKMQYLRAAALLPGGFCECVEKRYMRSKSAYLELLLGGACLLWMVSCSDWAYHKLPSGIEYRFIERKKSGKRPGNGDYLRIRADRYIGNMLVERTPVGGELYVAVTHDTKGTGRKYDFADVFPLFKEGDSVHLRAPLDSVLDPFLRKTTPHYAREKYVQFHLRVERVLHSDEVGEDKRAQHMVVRSKQPDDIRRFCVRKRFAFTCRDSLFLFFHRLSGGYSAQPRDTILVRYRGELLNGTVFDQNFPSVATPSPEQLSFVLGSDEMIRGFDRALYGTHVGDSLSVVIPSDLAYGEKGAGQEIPPHSPLYFVVRVEGIHPAKHP